MSLTVMLIGLAIEEDTKKSKRGCEALAISFLTWSVVCQAARSATSSASNGPGRRARQRWLCYPNVPLRRGEDRTSLSLWPCDHLPDQCGP